MKDWLVCPVDGGGHWLTRIEVLPNGRKDYLCGCCDGPLEDSVLAFFASSKGLPGTVACSICCRCNLLLGAHDMPASELDTQIELVLAKPTIT